MNPAIFDTIEGGDAMVRYPRTGEVTEGAFRP